MSHFTNESPKNVLFELKHVPSENNKSGRYKCSEEEACSNPHGFEISINRSTIINKFSLYCEAKGEKDVYIFLIILIGGFAYLVVCVFSNKFGRSNIFRFSVFWGVLGMIAVIISLDLFTTMAGFTLLSFASDVNNTMCYIYMSEVVLDNFRNWASFVFVLCFFVGEIFSGLVGLAFDDFQVISFFFLMLSIPIIIFLFQLKKSPYFLKSKGEEQEFCDLFNHIIKTNSVSPENVKNQIQNLQNNAIEFGNIKIENQPTKITTNMSNSEKLNLKTTENESNTLLKTSELASFFKSGEVEDSNRVGLAEYFSNCSNVMKLIAYVFLLTNFYWTIGLTVFLPEMIGFKSLYSNMFFMGCSDFVGGIFMILFINRTRRRILNFYNLISNCVTVAILLLIQQFGITEYYYGKILDIILSCKIYFFEYFKSIKKPHLLLFITFI